MKKLLFVFAIGIAVASCNNNASDKPAGDTTAATVTVDTTAKAAVVDTMKHDTLAPAKVDTLKK